MTPHILVTNDDGIDGPGLLALKQAMAAIGDVSVIAPDHNWSAAGHSKTMHKPLRINKVHMADGDHAYSTDGAPSDCVAIAILGFLGKKVDLIVSGVNNGSNMGDDVTYSGTVAAAMEGIIWGVPAIAVSLDGFVAEDPDANNFALAARVAERIAAHMLAGGWKADTLLNINVPNRPENEVTGLEITRLGRRGYRDELIMRTDPFGRHYYWIGGGKPTLVNEQGTDIRALSEGRIAITPIHLDLTDHQAIEQLSNWHLDWR